MFFPLHCLVQFSAGPAQCSAHSWAQERCLTALLPRYGAALPYSPSSCVKIQTSSKVTPHCTYIVPTEGHAANRQPGEVNTPYSRSSLADISKANLGRTWGGGRGCWDVPMVGSSTSAKQVHQPPLHNRVHLLKLFLFPLTSHILLGLTPPKRIWNCVVLSIFAANSISCLDYNSFLTALLGPL